MNLRHPFFLCLFLLTLPFLLVLPRPARAAAPRGPLRVFVSILPAEYLAEQIGGSRVRVDTLVQPGHNPHTYAPTPRQMALLAEAQLYYRIGIPFEEPLISKLRRTVPDLKIIDLRAGISLLRMQGDDEDHDEQAGDLDPHTWLDPMQALKQAQTMHDTMVAADPAGREEYDRNLARLSDNLHRLDQALRTVLAPLAGRTIYVFHPAYGYFCRTYNLRQKAINVLGKETGARHLARLIEEARQDGVRVIFVQPEFSEKTAATIAQAIGGSVVPLDPLAHDYLTNMESIARQIAASQPRAGAAGR